MLFLKSTVLGVVARLAAAYRRNRQRNEALDSLYRLNDRLLADIGIMRQQIPNAVDGSLGTSTTETFKVRQSEKQSWTDWILEIAACRTLS